MDYSILKERLADMRAGCIEALRLEQDPDVLAEKTQIDSLLRWIQWFESYGIDRHRLVALPQSWSDLRVIDDNETDDRAQWRDLSREDDAYFLDAGDFLLKAPRQ